MQKQILLLSLITLIAIPFFLPSTPTHPSFEEWQHKHRIPMTASEQIYRKVIYQQNLAIIEKHNQDESRTFDMGVNQFSIYSDEEFSQLYLSSVPPPSEFAVASTEPTQPLIKTPNAAIDWVTAGKVTAVSDQGQCGAGYAFTTTSLLESWSLAKGNSTRISLSKQQLVDCTIIPYHNHGCHGGWPYVALKYVTDKGITNDLDYPYTANSSACKTPTGPFIIQGYTNHSGCPALISAVTQAPVAVMVGATDWKNYKAGVFGTKECKRGNTINHSALLVGLSENNQWKLKNSWGSEWGEAGYIRMSAGNTCGICSYAGALPK